MVIKPLFKKLSLLKSLKLDVNAMELLGRWQKGIMRYSKGQAARISVGACFVGWNNATLKGGKLGKREIFE